MCFSVGSLGLDILKKICLQADEKSLLHLASTCKPFHELIFSYPGPNTTDFETEIMLRKWQNREISSQQIWNACFQKTHEKTIDQMLIILSKNSFAREKECKLLLEIIQSDKKIPKQLSLNTLLNPQNGYEKIKCCFFYLKLNSSCKRLTKELQDFKNDPLYTNLTFSITPKNLTDKMSLLLFEKDYELFKKTKNPKSLNRWQWNLFLVLQGNRRITVKQALSIFRNHDF